MSKVIEYVGFFQVVKDQVREGWTQFWGQASTPPPPIVEQGDDASSCPDRETNFRTKVKERLDRLKKQTVRRIDRSSSVDEDFSHLTRPKSRRELVQVSAAVMGIEFSYAAETAFVSPLLLNIGLRHRHMTLMWCLSPLVGLFLTPLLGSLSDGCRSSLGRRRPFILLLSIGIILGLLLVPNGKLIGRWLGDTYKDDANYIVPTTTTTRPPGALSRIFLNSDISSDKHNDNLTSEETSFTFSFLNGSETQPTFSTTRQKNTAYYSKYATTEEDHGFRARNNLAINDDMEDAFLKQLRISQAKKLEKLPSKKSINYEAQKPQSSQEGEDKSRHEDENSVKNHPWGLVFTVLGTVLLDFDADACQSPARAYMLDVTIPEDHARGLSTFTVMAGLGGSLGYFLGALNWENTLLGDFFGGQVRAVFTLVLFIFIGCVITTIRSFREIPLDRLWATQSSSITSSGPGIGIGTARFVTEPQNHKTSNLSSPYARFEGDPDHEHDVEAARPDETIKGYGSTIQHETSFSRGGGGGGVGGMKKNGESNVAQPASESAEIPTFKEYLKTIILLPKSLQWLCLTNFFCWMSLVCYSLYFTDFVGEAVFNGDPTAPLGTESRKNYDDGIRFGCWGMSIYSMSCSIYSLCIESFVSRFGAKRVYITGQLVYSAGMVLMALFRHKFGVIVFSWTAGIMYATLFTMPYLLVARYHAAETFDIDIDDLVSKPSSNQIRGLGTDVAIVSSMVFLAQMTQAIILGSIVAAVGSTTAIVCAASVFAACGALTATKVLYLDL